MNKKEGKHMKIITVNDRGEKEIIQCSKIEPATLSKKSRIIVDDGERVIDIIDVIKIVEG